MARLSFFCPYGIHFDEFASYWKVQTYNDCDLSVTITYELNVCNSGQAFQGLAGASLAQARQQRLLQRFTIYHSYQLMLIFASQGLDRPSSQVATALEPPESMLLVARRNIVS